MSKIIASIMMLLAVFFTAFVHTFVWTIPLAIGCIVIALIVMVNGILDVEV